MLELFLIVQENVIKEMKGKKGTTIQDGWSRFGKHFVVLLVCYMLEKSVKDPDGKVKKTEVP